MKGFFYLFIFLFIRMADAQTLPQPKHIVIQFPEDKRYPQLIGDTVAPYINALANDSLTVLFTNSWAAFVGYSQPNYPGFYSGDRQGVGN